MCRQNAACTIDDSRAIGEVLDGDEERRVQSLYTPRGRGVPQRERRDQTALAVCRPCDRVEIITELIAHVLSLELQVHANGVAIA
jgi:hypothetical protein